MQSPKPPSQLRESALALVCMATLDLASPHRAAGLWLATLLLPHDDVLQ
jgi:hypothetical protein